MKNPASIMVFLLFSCVFSEGTVSKFLLGSHLTHATSREDHGFVYRDENGEPEDPYVTFARLGGNFVMMDHFVSCGYYGLEDIVRQSMRAEGAGLMVGINFHYSQHYQPDTIPHGWPQTYLGLKEKIYQYTDSVLTVLRDSGVTVDLVKVGNEIDWAKNEKGQEGKTGLLFPIGDYKTQPSQFFGLLSEGSRAVRDFDPTIPIALHLIPHDRQKTGPKFFQTLADSGISFDICAISWYSNYGQSLNKLDNFFTEIIEVTGKQTMVTECAFAWTDENFGPPDNKGHSNNDPFDATKEGARDYYLALIDKVAKLPGNKGIGVVTWPGAYTFNPSAPPSIADGCGSAFMKDPFSTGTNSIGRSSWDNSSFWHSETGKILPTVVSAFDTCVTIGSGLDPNCHTTRVGRRFSVLPMLEPTNKSPVLLIPPFSITEQNNHQMIQIQGKN